MSWAYFETLNRLGMTSWCKCCLNRVQIRQVKRVALFILLALLLPPLELLRRYHDDIWEYCPNTNFDWDSEIVNAACEIPTLNLWDPTILKYFNATQPAGECLKDYPLLRLVWSATSPESPAVLELTEKGHKELPHLNCVYQTVTRNEDDETLEYGQERQAVFPLEMTDEVIRIRCREKSNEATFYTDVFGAIKPVKRESNRKQSWNVLIIGVDSVSRQSFIRFLPKTYEYLKSNGVHVFEAYHKIGENTFPNLVPMLTGRKVELSSPSETLELPHSGNIASYILRRPFDSYPFIWQDFARAGSVTGYVEDYPGISTFNYLKAGFKQQPTDHYGRTLFLAIEELLNNVKEFNPSLAKMDLKTGEWESMEYHHFCINGRRKFEVLWDYAIRQFITRYYQHSPTFMFSWLNGLTHHWLTTVKEADLPLLDLLKFLLEEPAPWRNNTFVIIVSDHGQRVDKIRASFVGRLEDRLPFLAISVPPAFRQKYPEMSSNLARNEKRLVTALDIYATFKDILYHSGDDFTGFGPSGYATSLFRPINPLRSCTQAGIPEWYCACHRYVELNSTSDEAIAASNAMAKAIADELAEGIKQGFCANLTVAKIEQIRRVEYTRSARSYTTKCRFFGLIKESGDVGDVFDEYVVQITMKPGGGKFEATVRNNWRTGLGWNVIGGVERANRYGNQSACLPESLSKANKMCYCPTGDSES